MGWTTPKVCLNSPLQELHLVRRQSGFLRPPDRVPGPFVPLCAEDKIAPTPLLSVCMYTW